MMIVIFIVHARAIGLEGKYCYNVFDETKIDINLR